MDLIDRQAAIDLIDAGRLLSPNEPMWSDNEVIGFLNRRPTVDAEPVIHAKWICSPDHSEGACTNCNYKIYGRPYQNTYLIVSYNYCPNCGAKMDGG